MESIFFWLPTFINTEFIKSILVSVPGVVLGGFSLYFAYQKIGNRVLATYSIVLRGVTEERISDITLVNKKNKPITIFSIQAVINEDVVIEVENFQPALVLKPLESIYIDTSPFSHLHIGSDRYKANYLSPSKVDLYLISENKKILCKVIRPPSLSKYFDFNHYRNAIKGTMSYNGKIYNDRVRYAIVYRYDSQQHTAFVEESGFIGEGWGYYYNMVPESHMASKEAVKEFLIGLGYDKSFQALMVEDIKNG